MYRIGEFSYLFKVTIKTLRHYDKIDLFKPSFKDPFTGYRYYSEDQVEEFENILKLKSFHFTLDEIKELKQNLDKDLLNEKIKQLEQEQEVLTNKINELEVLKGEKEEMKYKVGFSSNRKFNALGKRIIIEKRDPEILEKHFEELEKKFKKLGFPCYTRVIITLEIGWKEEDVELFIGEIINISDRKIHKKLSKIRSNEKKYGLEYFAYPTSDYLAAIDIESQEKIPEACKSIIEYANQNRVQILGPFMELYRQREDNKIEIFVNCYDLRRDEVYDYNHNDNMREHTKEFISDPSIIGEWKIREILPNIDFNPERQKSNPDTIYQELTLFEDGTTNYENARWTKIWLIIEYDNHTTYNLTKKRVINGKEYLEIRMSDMSTIEKNAKPISYIYERK